VSDGRGFDPAYWSGFCTAEVGAAAALTGLLFVAVSINLARILEFPKLPARAAETLAVLLQVLVCSSLVLVPQPVRALGAELLVLTLGLLVVILRVQLMHGPDSPDDPLSWFASRVAITEVPGIAFVVAGVSLLVGHGGGLYWIIPGTLLGFVGASYNAWVLLVEIIRQKPVVAPDLS
jgi:hypothetical protein